MIYTTTESIPGREITEILAVVNGNVVQSKHLGGDIIAQLKSLVGGEISATPKCSPRREPPHYNA
ncbi:MAG: heavy metal-binding domain-containing protein [Porticoccaceae bacterium]|nr:heavy metal-binding domain-containing protein [Porticoccaceae bacterium]